MSLNKRSLRVQRVSWEADGVVSLRLTDPDGADLEPWLPGSHLDLVLPSGLTRQYSLCGASDDDRAYTVAVLRDPASRGGSEEIHSTALVGRMIEVRGPKNHFSLAAANHYLFFAGGIGITPIVAMIRSVHARGGDWRLVYGGRSRASMAFLPELLALDKSRVQVVPQDELGLPNLAGELGAAALSTAVYCCGPEGLIRAVEERCAETLGAAALHVERFGAPSEVRDVARGEDVPGRAFKVELRKSGVTLEVPPDRTMLSVVQDVIPDYPFSCTEGYCGTCEAAVLEGEPEHRDTVLSDEERAAGNTLMICVGRSKSPKLVLDV